MGQQHSQDKTGMREARKRSMKRLNGWLACCCLASYRPLSVCSRRGRAPPLIREGRDRHAWRHWREAAAGIAGQGDWQGDWPKREHR